MASSPLILAALAKAALPSHRFKSVTTIPSNGEGVIFSVLLTDVDGSQYIVRESKNAKGNLQLASDNQAAKVVRSAGNFSFALPQLVGETQNEIGNTVQVLEFIYGQTVDLYRLTSQDLLLASIGGTLAAIHQTNLERIRQSGVPEFSANQIRESRLAELDRAATTGQVPATLLQRWENALEDLDLFRFQETFIHGNLTSGNLLEQDSQVAGVLGWASARIGDPAEDLVPFALIAGGEVLDALKFAYFEHRSETDANIAQRATLYAEMDIARYLVNMVAAGNQSEAEWAVGELVSVADQVSSGEARLLSTNGFVALSPLVEPDTHTIVTEVLPEVAAETDDFSDLATKPIDLPEKSDDQLF